ncbi:PA14 domain-containing protein [uncultured Pontibacter sp.]|uniref:PA14 domain-containing protein n=1 Tax=uncultured Pontibacter sp. TaxID=453356 RepID=UPI0026309DDC|nr:PA14 domain-containing protein [uncultured Pontibacter sp.]
MNTSTSYQGKGAGRVLLALVLTFVLCVLTPISKSFAQTYSGPLVITKGGTYTGNWESRDSEVSAVEIRTNEPVVIVNSNIRGAGPLVRSLGNSADITIRHTNGYGLTPTPWKDYKKARRFLGVDVFRNIVVENCYMENTAGIYIGQRYEGNGSTNNTIKIRYNKAKNIDGRVHGGQTFAQFVQFNYRNAAPHVEVAWNQVINDAGNSAVEDNINIYNTKGTPSSPIKIHNNYIEGAYPIPHTGSSYSGGGIITDGDGDISIAPAYIEANDNHLVNLGNYSMGIAGGNNVRYHHNRAINSATFKNGSKVAFYTSGMWSKDYYKKNTTFNNSVDNNTIGITAWGYTNNRNDVSVAENAAFTNNTFLTGSITLQTEADEFSRWNQKLAQNGIKLGPNGSAPAATQPAPAPAPKPEPAPAPVAPVAPAAGKITREYWANAAGAGISDIPVSKAPTSTTDLTSFEAPSNVGDNYGQRIRGYVTAPESGQYTFWVAGDNSAELWLSTSEDPAAKAKLAYVNGWTNPREWAKYSSQQSVKVTLQAGKRYYIEALMKEENGGDNLAVGWQLPSGAQERPIAGNRLSQLGTSAPVAQPTPAQPTPTPTPTPTPAPTAPVAPATGKITREYWANAAGAGISDIPVSKAPTSTTDLTSFEAPSNVGDNYGQRIRGYVTAPESGQYTFWVAGDNSAELWLSTSEDPAAKAKLAYVNGWTNPREWAKYSSQQSVKVTLQAGKRYYIEALMKEENGGDNLAVGWQLPSGAQERPIAGNRLSQLGTSAPVAQPTPAQPTPTPAPVVATGKIMREFWANVNTESISQLPLTKTPTNVTELTSLETTSNMGDNYGQRIRGYITAPENGQYTFWIAGDNNAELWLSTSTDPAKKVKLAYVNGWTNPREYTKYATQQSVKVTLEAGKMYYIEVLHVEGAGGDNLSVSWQLPSGAKEAPVAGKHLSPLSSELSGISAMSVSEAADVTLSFEGTTAYPNPFKDMITLDFGNKETKLQQVVLVNQAGKVVYEEKGNLQLTNSKLEINLSAITLQSGLYFLKYTDAQGNTDTIKVIKE